MRGTALDSIGATGGITGSCMLAIVTHRQWPNVLHRQWRMRGWVPCQIRTQALPLFDSADHNRD
jgi:hypothetical protein